MQAEAETGEMRKRQHERHRSSTKTEEIEHETHQSQMIAEFIKGHSDAVNSRSTESKGSLDKVLEWATQHGIDQNMAKSVYSQLMTDGQDLSSGAAQKQQQQQHADLLTSVAPSVQTKKISFEQHVSVQSSAAVLTSSSQQIEMVQSSKQQANLNEITPVKQLKTRNNLQSHTVSTNLHAPRRVLVGQPYITFKNQLTGGQLTSRTASKKNTTIMMDRHNHVYLKHQQVLKNRQALQQTSSSNLQTPGPKRKNQTSSSDLLHILPPQRDNSQPRQVNFESFSRASSQDRRLILPEYQPSRSNNQFTTGRQAEKKPKWQQTSSLQQVKAVYGSNSLVNALGMSTGQQSGQSHMRTSSNQALKKLKEKNNGRLPHVSAISPNKTTVYRKLQNISTSKRVTVLDQRAGSGEATYEVHRSPETEQDSLVALQSTNLVSKMRFDRKKQLPSLSSRTMATKQSEQGLVTSEQELASVLSVDHLQMPPVNGTTALKQVVEATKETSAPMKLLAIEESFKKSLSIVENNPNNSSNAAVTANSKLRQKAGSQLQTMDDNTSDIISDAYPSQQQQMHTSTLPCNLWPKPSMQQHENRGSHLSQASQKDIQSNSSLFYVAPSTTNLKAVKSHQHMVGAPYGVQQKQKGFTKRPFNKVSSTTGIEEESMRKSSMQLLQTNFDTSSQCAKKQNFLHRRLVNQQQVAQQHAGFQSQQLKKFAIKESLKLEPIFNNRYMKNQEKDQTSRSPPRGSSKQQTSPQNQTQLKRNASQLSQNNSLTASARGFTQTWRTYGQTSQSRQLSKDVAATKTNTQNNRNHGHTVIAQTQKQSTQRKQPLVQVSDYYQVASAASLVDPVHSEGPAHSSGTNTIGEAGPAKEGNADEASVENKEELLSISIQKAGTESEQTPFVSFQTHQKQSLNSSKTQQQTQQNQEGKKLASQPLFDASEDQQRMMTKDENHASGCLSNDRKSFGGTDGAGAMSSRLENHILMQHPKHCISTPGQAHNLNTSTKSNITTPLKNKSFKSKTTARQQKWISAAYEQLPYLRPSKIGQSITQRPLNADKKRSLHNNSTTRSPSPAALDPKQAVGSAEQIAVASTINQTQVSPSAKRKTTHSRRKSTVQASLESKREKKMTSPDPGLHMMKSTYLSHQQHHQRKPSRSIKKFATNEHAAKTLNSSHKLSNSVSSLPKTISEERLKERHAQGNKQPKHSEPVTEINRRPSHRVLKSKYSLVGIVQSPKNDQDAKVSKISKPLTQKRRDDSRKEITAGHQQANFMTAKDRKNSKKSIKAIIDAQKKSSQHAILQMTPSSMHLTRSGEHDLLDRKSNENHLAERSEEESEQMKFLQIDAKASPILGLDDMIMKHSKSTATQNEKQAGKAVGRGNEEIKISEGQLFQTMPLNTPQANIAVDRQTSSMDREQLAVEYQQSASTEHQIRIEISKTSPAVLDSMKKEHQKDLSLLYYDFNNSKARLMSKISRKVSDQVIQEENAEADQDATPIVLSSREQERADDLVQKLLDHENTGAEPSPAHILKPISKLSSENVHPFKASGESNLVALRSKEQSDATKQAKKSSNVGMIDAKSGKKIMKDHQNYKTPGVIQSQDSLTIKSDIDFVNKKISKAKQSISQLQTEGGLHSMGLQSPARLALSRNSSTNTLKQSQSIRDEPSPQYQMKPKKILLFNPENGSSSIDLHNSQQAQQENMSAKQNRDRSSNSPFFGSEGGANIAANGGSGSNTMIRVSQTNNALTPGLINKAKKEIGDDGCTGATGLQEVGNASSLNTKDAGYVSPYIKDEEYKNSSFTPVGNLTEATQSPGFAHPMKSNNGRDRAQVKSPKTTKGVQVRLDLKKIEDGEGSAGDGAVIGKDIDDGDTESFCEQAQSSRIGDKHERMSMVSGDATVPSKVTSVIAFVYENKKIWE